MDGAIRILAIPGSLRRDSLNLALLRAAAELAPPGVELELYDGLKEIPPFDPDDEAYPGEAVSELRELVASADAVLIATPEYNGSIPGQLKNAVDWLSRPRDGAALAGKPAAAIGASPGMFGAAWAQAELAKVLGHSGARVVDSEIAVARADQALDRDLDPALATQLRELLELLAAEVETRLAVVA